MPGGPQLVTNPPSLYAGMALDRKRCLGRSVSFFKGLAFIFASYLRQGVLAVHVGTATLKSPLKTRKKYLHFKKWCLLTSAGVLDACSHGTPDPGHREEDGTQTRRKDLCRAPSLTPSITFYFGPTACGGADE